MKNRNVVAHKQRLDALFDSVNQVLHETEFEDYKLNTHLPRYLCVLVSGFLEESVRVILTDFAGTNTRPEIASYVARQLRDFQNAKMERILDLIGTFDASFRVMVETESKGEIAEAVDGIVSRRHQIAHGKDAGMSFGTIRDYYKSAVKLIERLDQRFQ